MARQDVGQPVAQFGVEQVAGGEVDRHPERQALGARVGQQARYFFKHPQREVAHKPGLLGKRDELHGWHQPALRVLPAHQCLGRLPRPPVQGHLGLQVQAQLRVLHGVAQLGQQRQGLRAERVKRRVVLQSPAELALGGVHGNFRTAEQRVGVARIVRPAGKADASAQGCPA